MFAPKSYTIYKLPLSHIAANDYHITQTREELRPFQIQQQDSSLLRLIRIITQTDGQFNPYIVFVNIDKKDKEVIRNILLNGFSINGVHFVASERSASMTRTGILSFVDQSIAEELERRINMNITFDKTVLSKYYAYRGLMLSACHMLEGFRPKVIVVPDFFTVIPNQHIKYAYDDTVEFVDKEGQNRTWVQKNIGEDWRDIEINGFDGCGIHHPAISRQVEEILGSKTSISSILWRFPWIKGMTHEMDYEGFYAQRGVSQIQDIWGVFHDFSEPMIILTESQYKGYRHFHTYGDGRDWQLYWEKFEKYDHCIGIAKWNFTAEEEPVYTRANYQILQDLNLPYETFRHLANYSVDWVEQIIHGDTIYTWCFLGMFADNHKPKNAYIAAMLKNPQMLKEQSVKTYLLNLLAGYKDEMKCGKLWLKSTFKFAVPDLIMLMEHIGGLTPTGCLEKDQFYAHSKDGPYEGEFLIERNPHICRSEHVVLQGTRNELIDTWCSHLDNVCMLNSKSITAQRLNGADYDGDLVLLIDNEIMMAGVDRDAAVVLDVEDKATALAEENTPANRVALVLRTINSLIGETSNCATGYHNKMPKSLESKRKYESYVDLLSIINGKNIDLAKTGVMYHIPKHIAKYSKPLPYFMKYASDYYRGLNTFSHAPSNMNRLCKDLEKWSKSQRYTMGTKDFDYHIMIDDTLPFDEAIQQEVNALYLAFCKEMTQLAHDQAAIRKYGDPSLSSYDAKNFTINWKYYYDTYRDACRKICSDPRILANMAVRACYEYYPQKRNTKFMWRVAGEGIVMNLKQQVFPLPLRDDEGPYEYLGKRYRLETVDLLETMETTETMD